MIYIKDESSDNPNWIAVLITLVIMFIGICLFYKSFNRNYVNKSISYNNIYIEAYYKGDKIYNIFIPLNSSDSTICVYMQNARDMINQAERADNLNCNND